MKISDLLKDYWKELFLFVVAPTFSWWLGGFNVLSNYLYGNTYEISKATVLLSVLLVCLFSSIAVRKYLSVRREYERLKKKNEVREIEVELEKVLALIYHMDIGYLQSRSTLVEAGCAADIQTGQYYLEKLESYDFIESNYHIPETEEQQYELTQKGRAFVIENNLQNRHNNSSQVSQQSCALA